MLKIEWNLSKLILSNGIKIYKWRFYNDDVCSGYAEGESPLWYFRPYEVISCSDPEFFKEKK
jgi:hypothetical protein